jgi:hypothetical protein
MNRISLVIALSILLCAPSLWAEFYKYYDQNGNVYFTDDYNQVPTDQRDKVEGYSEYVNEENKAAPNPTGPQDALEAPQGAANAGVGNAGLDAKIQQLDRRKMELAREYDGLIKENQRLAEIKNSIQTTEDAANYNEQIKQLNARIKAHDQKRKQWFSDVEAYNAEVASQSQKGKK